MLSFVNIKDFVINETYQIIFDEDEYKLLDAVWNEPNNQDIVTFAVGNDVFVGRTTYSSLMPIHFQLLISSHISKLEGKDKDERERLLFDDAEEFHQKLKIYLMGLIRSIVIVTTSFVDIISIELLTDNKINFICNLGICIESSKAKTNVITNSPKNRGNLKIVVDNTKH